MLLKIYLQACTLKARCLKSTSVIFSALSTNTYLYINRFLKTLCHTDAWHLYSEMVTLKSQNENTSSADNLRKDCTAQSTSGTAAKKTAFSTQPHFCLRPCLVPAAPLQRYFEVLCKAY